MAKQLERTTSTMLLSGGNTSGHHIKVKRIFLRFLVDLSLLKYCRITISK